VDDLVHCTLDPLSGELDRVVESVLDDPDLDTEFVDFRCGVDDGRRYVVWRLPLWIVRKWKNDLCNFCARVLLPPILFFLETLVIGVV